MENETEKTEEKKGMSFEERVAVVEQATGMSKPESEINDDDIFNPEAKVIVLGSRKYEIKPLKLKEMRVLIQLSKIDLKNFDESQLQQVIDCISIILHEPDKDVLESEIDIPVMMQLFEDISKVNYNGVPKPVKADKKKAGN